MVGAQIDDSKSKYQRVQWLILYPDTKTATADSLQTILINDQKLYQYKSTDPLQEIKEINKPILMSGSLTFINSVDAQAYYTKIIITLKGSDVLYAKIFLLDNSHHWSNDKIQPDVILGQTTYGDKKQYEIFLGYT